MAKKNNYDPYRSQQEAIRKAKGNPNKNQHHKKKEGKIYGLITIALAVFCVIYGGMGLIGLMNALGVM